MKFITAILAVAFVVTAGTHAAHAVGTSGLVNGIWFSDDPVTDFEATTVHSVVHNHTDSKLQGIVTLVVDGDPVGAQEVQIGIDGIAHVRITYKFPAGAHTVSMSFTAGNGTDVTLSELSEQEIFVVQDTDGDGIRNTTDPDDDNDSIPDVEDSNPLVKDVLPVATVSLSEQGKALLDRLTNRDEEEVILQQETAVSEQGQATSTEPHALVETFQRIEAARKRTAETVRSYEEEQRAALEELARAEEELPAVEGFEPSAAQESKKREHQIAAAGAAVTGTVLEHGWLFYLHIFILVASVVHLGWGWFRKRFATAGVDGDE